MSILEKIKEMGASLPNAQRAELAQYFLRTLDADEDENVDEEVEAAWADELAQRAAAIRGGQTKGVPAESVHAQLRERLL